MQIDMHYYGTYALARAAGMARDAARVAASAAQFVDDMTGSAFAGNNVCIQFQDGGSIVSRATAHHATHLIKNIDASSQRHVWVPFHFLPGDQGESFTARLQCAAGSEIAWELVDHHAAFFGCAYGLELAGVTAHVLADTFSHYGFSGVSSRRNRVEKLHAENATEEMRAYIERKKKRFWRKFAAEIMENIRVNFISDIAEGAVAALGHGAAATYPDRPYLIWTMEYEYPQRREVRRDNPATFLAGCEALHTLFAKVVAAREQMPPGQSGVTEQRKAFGDIKEEVEKILALQAPKEGRIEAWQNAVRRGTFGPGEDIPEYLGAKWNEQHEQYDGSEKSTDCLNHSAYLFLRAASMHRNYVLRELLPKHRLVVA